MKYVLTLLLLVLLLPLVGEAQNANAIAGTVSDPNGAAISGANVTARRGAEVFTTTSDDKGRFVFNNLGGGNYLLTVIASGFSVFTRDAASGASDLQITLTVASPAETVVIQAEVDSYLADTSTTGTKLDIPQRDLPQAISVVPSAIIEDRLIVRLTEAGDNVAGVRSLTSYTGTKSNNYIIRGFGQSYLSTNTLRNGFTEFAQLTQRDPVNIDRIEFLKGPASLLYGSNDIGGLVNTITKKPLTEHRYDLGLTAGGFGLFRPTVDATGPINSSKTLLYRATFAFDQGNSYRDLVNNRNVFFAPSLTWKIGERTTLLTELELGRFRNDFDRGFPTEIEFLDEDPTKNYSEPWTNAINSNLNIMFNFTHAFNEQISFRAGFNHVRSKTDVSSVFFATPRLQADRRTINRRAIESDEYSENYNSQNEFYARFSTGRVRHQLVAGVEYARFRNTYIFDLFTLAPIDRINPVYGALPGSFLFDFNDDSSASQYGIYVQDQIELLPNLKLLIGGRGSFFDAVSKDFPAGTIKNEQNFRSFTPRVGIVFQPTQTTSLYISYARSFAPNFDEFSSTGEQFEPTTGRLFEAGIKQNFLNNRILTTIAVYQLQRLNALVPDPNDPTFSFSIQTGEQRGRGLEFELNGQITRGLNLNATYSAIDAVVSRDTRSTFIGQKLVGVPKHSGSVYANYSFDKRVLRGFSVGGGVFLATEQFSNLPNRVWRLPGYTRVDLNFGYRRENWRFDLAIKNLNNARYFETGTSANAFLPQATRHALASISYSF